MNQSDADLVAYYEGQGFSYAAACRLAGVQVSDVMSSEKRIVLDDVDFKEVCREQLPQLMLQLVEYAKTTDDEKFLLSVVRELADRGYGKATQSIEVSNPARDIRSAWSEMEDIGDVDVIDAEVIDG